MFVSPTHRTPLQGLTTPSASKIRWEDFDLQVVELSATITSGNVENELLNGTQLSCTISTEAGQWENRKIFIENILADIIEKCPKDEPITLISFGSDRLLTEYILGKVLIENGYRQISFLLVDPAYAFSSREDIKDIQNVLKDFRENIESTYLSINKAHFPKENIRFLSRSQNIGKYFAAGSNVVVIESLPPYAEMIKDMKKSQVEAKNPQDLIIGGHIVQSNHANTVAFIPTQYMGQLNASGAKLTAALPLAIYKSDRSNFYLDWGCKIGGDGTYCLTFSGDEHYLESLGISSNRQMKLPKGEVIQAGQWIPKIKSCIEEMLSEQIESFKKDDPQKQLSQEIVTILLEKVKEIVMLYMPGTSCFFSADYVLDRDVAMTFIAANAGHHYRKAFSLTADADSGYKILVEEIK